MIEPGTELADKYRVLRLVGEGGMGAVYEAVHALVGRRVAVKILHAQYCRNELALARFAREARAAGATGHEHIVEVLDFGTHHGMPFLVMEFLQGQTLAERLAKDEPVPVKDACRIAGQLLSALAAAHAAGVVHRDLKPENVFLLARSGGRIHAKLVDFGVSKFQSGADANTNVTEDGTTLGTPAYMSPEQWMGRRDVDHRSDLFSVGVLLYELLTGQFPYEGDTRGELFLQVVQGTNPPEAPSALRPEVPPGLDEAVLRAVERDRSVRFASAQEFLAALAPYGADGIEAVELGPATIAPESLLPFRRSDPRTATRVDKSDGAPSSRPPPSYPTRTSDAPVRSSLAGNSDAEALALTIAAAPTSLALRTSNPVVPAGVRGRIPLVGVAIAALGLLAGTAWALRTAVSSSGTAASQRVPSAASAPSVTARASVAPSVPTVASATAAPSAAPEMVTITLQGLRESATVTVDDALHSERPLRVARGDREVNLVIEDEGSMSPLPPFRPDHDQTIAIPPPARTSARRPNPRSNRAGQMGLATEMR